MDLLKVLPQNFLFTEGVHFVEYYKKGIFVVNR